MTTQQQYDANQWQRKIDELKKKADARQTSMDAVYAEANEKLAAQIKEVSEKNRKNFEETCGDRKKCTDDRNQMYGEVINLNIPDIEKLDPNKFQIPGLESMSCDPGTGNIITEQKTEQGTEQQSQQQTQQGGRVHTGGYRELVMRRYF